MWIPQIEITVTYHYHLLKLTPLSQPFSFYPAGRWDPLLMNPNQIAFMLQMQAPWKPVWWSCCRGREREGVVAAEREKQRDLLVGFVLVVVAVVGSGDGNGGLKEHGTLCRSR